MFAVIETGGKQYKVSPGDQIRAERISGEIGERVRLTVLYASEGEAPIAVAEIVDQGRGEKIRVFKKKRRKNYRRSRGHRQSFTELRIVEFMPS